MERSGGDPGGGHTRASGHLRCLRCLRELGLRFLERHELVQYQWPCVCEHHISFKELFALLLAAARWHGCEVEREDNTVEIR